MTNRGVVITLLRKEIQAPKLLHSQEIVDIVQVMIDDDLGTFIRQIGRLLGNIDWVVRKIGKEK